MTFPEALRLYGRPPLALLNWLDKNIAAQGAKVPPEIVQYREFWRAVNAGEPVAELDKHDTSIAIIAA